MTSPTDHDEAVSGGRTPGHQEAPALPASVSTDGAEIWAWSGRLSQYTHWLNEKRQLHSDITGSSRECGSCEYWMKSRECPRERNDNGRQRGPSMKDHICARFAMSASSARMIEGWKSRLAELERIGPYSPEDDHGSARQALSDAGVKP